MRIRASKNWFKTALPRQPRSCSIDRSSVAVFLCLFDGGPYVSSVLSLFIPHPSFFWCPVRVVLGDCCIIGHLLLLFSEYSKTSMTRIPIFTVANSN